MVKNIKIDRECEHKIIMKEDMMLIITLTEFVEDINKMGKNTKIATTNVSLINDNDGAQISKIGGVGDTNDEAYLHCIENFNRNIDFHNEENRILLCCRHIPKLEIKDLRDFSLTRTIKIYWNEWRCALKAYVRKCDDHLIFTFDGSEECYHAQTDKEIIEFILSVAQFDESPKQTTVRRRGRLFYPTLQNFIR